MVKGLERTITENLLMLLTADAGDADNMHSAHSNR